MNSLDKVYPAVACGDTDTVSYVARIRMKVLIQNMITTVTHDNHHHPFVSPPIRHPTSLLSCILLLLINVVGKVIQS